MRSFRSSIAKRDWKACFRPTCPAYAFLQLDVAAMIPDQTGSFVETATRQADMIGMEFGARDNGGLAEGRQAHGLCAINFGF